MAGIQWDDNEYPVAYLITFRTYGTWLHGDARNSVDLRGQNVYRSRPVFPNARLEQKMRDNMTADKFLLNTSQRTVVEGAIREVCEHRHYSLSAINVRTNHVHSVVSGRTRPELMATAFKAYATRALKMRELIGPDTRVWSRGESTKYLWRDTSVERAIDYVLNGQGDFTDFE